MSADALTSTSGSVVLPVEGRLVGACSKAAAGAGVVGASVIGTVGTLLDGTLVGG